MRRLRLMACAVGLGAALASTIAVPLAQAAPGPEPGARYVALGSSFAAGPGIAPSVFLSNPVCARSQRNYAHQVADRLGLALTDVTCSGATTEHILTRSQYLQPPQIEAVTPDTRLVTVTIGGNDVGYSASLASYSCQNDPSAVPLWWGLLGACAPVDREAILRNLARVEEKLAKVSLAVQARAPGARVVWVDYLTVLPRSGQLCPGVPLTEEQADFELMVANRLREATRDAAARTGAVVVSAALQSTGHHACSAEPWVTGFVYGRPTPTEPQPYHPNLAGMTAVAELVARTHSSAEPN